MNANDAYTWLRQYNRRTAGIEELSELAGWDQRTMLPPKGHGRRAEQLAAAAAIVHERTAFLPVGEHLSEVEADESFLASDASIAANVREWRRMHDRAVKIPSELAEAWALAAAEGETAWEKARAADDWPIFAPYLERIFKLARERAEAIGYTKEPYDALIEDFEPGQTAASVSALFAALKPPLVSLIERISNSPKKPDTSILTQGEPIAAQEAFSRRIAALIGFDFDAGRLDRSTHPFTAGVGVGDARITSRYCEHLLQSGLFSTLHEAGHGMYEQGLPAAHAGEPRGRAVSLGVHESQSRLFENLVGRSKGFWKYVLPLAKGAFPTLKSVDLDAFYAAVNHVQADFIRVEADEVTYNLHIILRFELESALLRGEVRVQDLPEAWNNTTKQLLGIVPTRPAEGVLQDVHWSAGLIGYFPTYTLGNLYAAQIFDAAGRDLGDLDDAFAQGEFEPLLQWLRQKIHEKGSLQLPTDLICDAVGAPPDAGFLVRYLEQKYGEIFDC